MPDQARYAIDDRLRITEDGTPLSLPEVIARLNAAVDVVGKKEAAAIVGCHPNNLGRLPGLPRAEWQLAATPAWRREAIEAFAAARARAAEAIET